ncbi:MAG: A/G-specific adenine glycosylase [Paludibacteraceae bacterium]|nr:A/G-specific adenine glycosylase [Paludibacteraceae bacterium]
MTNKTNNNWFGDLVLAWYAKNGRQLPWRETKDAYRIWISEIILQQTQVAQGLPYYLRFTERFPTVKALAEANEDEVLKYWQGLGYYSRARNLHAAAQYVCNELGGQMPTDYEGLHAMKGVGDYTAADIAALAYNLPHAAIDGNVYRVLSRVFGIDTPIDSTKGKKEFAQLGAQLISTTEPGNFNQSLMDLGATVCTPKNALCEQCPLNGKCYALQNNQIDNLPVKEKKTKVRDRHFYYFKIELPGNDMVIRQRTDKDIWIGLFDFPMIESETELDANALAKTPAFEQLCQRFNGLTITHCTTTVKHQLSHQTLYATLLTCQATNARLESNELRIGQSQFDNYAIPKLIEKLIEAV